MNDQFLKLPEEKRLRIINAAMEVFSKNEYKRASTDLIAVKAGVSKGLLFYYFHNKKELYLYVHEYVSDLVKQEVADRHLYEQTDFYELLRYASAKKAELMRKTPYILDFSIRSFFADENAVSETINKRITDFVGDSYMQFFKNVNFGKFKEGADPFRIYKMLVWMAYGYLYEGKISNSGLDVDGMLKEFEQWTELFRKSTYREEYLE